MSISFKPGPGTGRQTGAAVERRYFPRRRRYRPLRFVGIGIIAMIAVVYLMYKLMVR
jgi:hypothetical protein